MLRTACRRPALPALSLLLLLPLACKSKERRAPAPATTVTAAATTSAPAPSASAAAKPKKPPFPNDEAVVLPKTDSAKPVGAAISEVKLDKYEVTVESYRQCVEAGCCDAETTPCDEDNNFGAPLWNEYCNYDKEGRDKHPMNCVDWYDADAYCRWMGKRLPTDAEWLHAAHGNDGQKYPWGNSMVEKKRLNTCDVSCRKALRERGRPWRAMLETDDGFPGTAPVGSFPDGVSPFGHLDMGGNVWEWLGDWFSPGLKMLPSRENPTGAPDGKRRVIRGGSWNDGDATELENQTRHGMLPADRFVNVGFRCAEFATDEVPPGKVCIGKDPDELAKRKNCVRSSGSGKECQQYAQCVCDLAAELEKAGGAKGEFQAANCGEVKTFATSLEALGLGDACAKALYAYKASFRALSAEGINVPDSCK